jgi:hypothetical protein
LRNCRRVVDLDSEIANSALNLRVAQQKLNRSKISRLTQGQNAGVTSSRRTFAAAFFLPGSSIARSM